MSFRLKKKKKRVSTSSTNSSNEPQNINEIEQAIQECVDTANKAAEAEMKTDIKTAKELYNQTAQKLDKITEMVPKTQSAVYKQYSSLYKKRSMSLQLSTLKPLKSTKDDVPLSPVTKSLKPMLSPPKLQRTPSIPAGDLSKWIAVNNTNNYSLPAFKIQFVENTIPPCPFNNDTVVSMKRPFVLMQRLATTMLYGGHLRSDLYIPKDVWFQQGAKLAAQQAKIKFCMRISSLLLELSKTNVSDKNEFEKCLDEFLQNCLNEKTILQKSLPSMRGSLKKDKSSAHVVKGKVIHLSKAIASKTLHFLTQKEKTKNHPYIPWLIAVSENTQFLLEWVDKFSTDSSISSKLEKISNFFQSSYCKFVLHDLQQLLERFLKESRKSFSRLAPDLSRFANDS